VRCPICEWDAPDQAVDCERCGKPLRSAAATPDFAPPVDGLEQTLHPSIDAAVAPLAALEPTALDDGGIPLPDAPIEVERTAIDPSSSGPSRWSGDVDLDRGREDDARPRTPAPAAENQRTRGTERQLCPACFARIVPYEDEVRGVLRCPECGVPLPLREVV
jgi:hypothetical protein